MLLWLDRCRNRSAACRSILPEARRSLCGSLGFASGGDMKRSFHHLDSGPQDFEQRAAYVGEVVSEPCEDGNGAKGGDADVEIEAELVWRGVGDPAQDWVTVHLGEDPNDAEAERQEQKGEQPVD